jgi:hypothetical protein
MHLSKTGESLSTSEIARLLLESSRDDRLEFVKLMAEPMKSLLNARRKLDSRLPLSHPEWMLIAYYCQLGAEAVACKIARIESQNPLDAVHVHCRREASIMDFRSCHSMGNNQPSPFPMHCDVVWQ